MKRTAALRLSDHAPRRGGARGRAAVRTAAPEATRQRVFDVATELFAEHGFKRVTVRQIAAAARANVAAVNYHFGDKAGLYSAVVDNAIRIMQETGRQAREAGEGLPPREQLHAFIRVFLTRITGSGHVPWIHRLMMRETDDPTEMLTRIVREVIEPRSQYLISIVGALTGLAPDDPRTVRAVASIQGQVLIFGRPMPAKLPPHWKAMVEDMDGVVEHITAFSLGGLLAVAAAEAPRGAARTR